MTNFEDWVRVIDPFQKAIDTIQNNIEKIIRIATYKWDQFDEFNNPLLQSLTVVTMLHRAMDAVNQASIIIVRSLDEDFIPDDDKSFYLDKIAELNQIADDYCDIAINRIRNLIKAGGANG